MLVNLISPHETCTHDLTTILGSVLGEKIATSQIPIMRSIKIKTHLLTLESPNYPLTLTTREELKINATNTTNAHAEGFLAAS